MDTKTDDPPVLRRRHGMKPTRERGRPARTSLGTASVNSSTRVDRQRRLDAASAEPVAFPPAGWPGAASQGNGAARNGIACGRDARAPGGALSHQSCSSRGHPPACRAAAGADAAVPSRLVALGRPSCALVDNSFYPVACSAKPGCIRQARLRKSQRSGRTGSCPPNRSFSAPGLRLRAEPCRRHRWPATRWCGFQGWRLPNGR